MPSVFIEPTSSEGWTAEQHQTAEALRPVLKAYLAEQMFNQPACDRFFDAQRAVTKVRHIDHSEWQTAVRIPVLENLGYTFEGPEKDLKYSALYHLLGAPTCLYMSFPFARTTSPAVLQSIEKETTQLVECLVTLGVQEKSLGALLDLCKRL